MSRVGEVGLRGHRVQDPERAEARRRGILLAAAEVFAEKGYAAATMDDVAERYGVTKGVLYYYFRTKEEIYVEIMATTILDATRRLGTIVARGEPPLPTLRAVLEGIVRHVVDQMSHYAIVLAQVYSLSDEAQRRLRLLRRRYLRLMQDIVEAGIAEAVFVKRDPGLTVSTALYACVSVAYWFQPGGAIAKEEVVQQVTDQVLAGIVSHDTR